MAQSPLITARFLVISTVSIFFFADAAANNPIVVERLDYDHCPRIVSRDEWQARNATDLYEPMIHTPTPYVVVHHGGIPHYCYDQPECSEIVRSYQNLHIDDRGWIDIGYNFVIGEDGNVYEGRGWDNVGAHSPGYNTQSIGISVIGDFNHFIPIEPALVALKSLIACGVQIGKISKNYKTIGHRQARDTSCPGEVFYNWVRNMTNWTNDPIPVYTTNSTSTTTNFDASGKRTTR